jgi:hypothetical protein
MDSYGLGYGPVVERLVNILVLQDVEILLTIMHSGCLWIGKTNVRQEMNVVTDYVRAHASSVTCQNGVRVKSQFEPCLKVLHACQCDIASWTLFM